jgi:hypothetical protein
MTETRRQRVMSALTAPTGAPTVSCQACRLLLTVSGVGITLVTPELRSQLCASDKRVKSVEDLQFLLGEGPSIDAGDVGEAVLADDLGSRASMGRWPVFAPEALALDTHAAFAFPLRVGAARLGVLTLYQDAPGRLRSEVHADALVAAEVLTEEMLSAQTTAPAGTLAVGLGEMGWEVHQATGMVSVQLSITMADALVRLRSHAFAAERELGEVSSDVIARRLRFEA